MLVCEGMGVRVLARLSLIKRLILGECVQVTFQSFRGMCRAVLIMVNFVEFIHDFHFASGFISKFVTN